MSDLLSKFDNWLKDDGPAALVIHEHLIPVEGKEAVLFPATFATSKDKTFKGGYNIDEFPDGRNVCLIDSVGSQANRTEPLFAKTKYAGLVPQIVVKAGSRNVNLLEAGHRAGDAIIRCSELQASLHEAFKAVQKGDAGPLAQIAPTSIVFGSWDSRDTQAKLPRLIASTIRAFDVHKLTRSAQYVPATEYIAEGLLPEPPDDKTRDAYAERGFVHVPSSASHGGVIANGGIQRHASLHLAALRLLATGEDEKKTLVLRRYILGLALTAFTYPPSGYLRQGCNLVLDADKAREFFEVYSDGQRKDATLTHEDAFAYAKAAAKEFGIDPDRKIDPTVLPDREVPFDTARAKKDVSGETDAGTKKARQPRGSRAA
jgi:CRISPR-associated protein Csb1